MLLKPAYLHIVCVHLCYRDTSKATQKTQQQNKLGNLF